MDSQYSLVLPKWVRHGNRPISCVSIHPSGQYFATGGWDNYVKIWNFNALIDSSSTKEKLVALLRDHTGSVNCVRFSPDGKYLASASDDSQVFLWQRVHSFGKPSVFGIPEDALKPNPPVQRWSSRSFTGHRRDVTSLSWSPDSQRIASCSIDGSLIVWDVKTNSQLWSYQMNIGIISVAWDPLNRFIVVQLMNSNMSIFDTQGRFIKEVTDCFETEHDMVSRISWSPDGSFIGATGGYRDSYLSPFFQRESFNFAFALEGHVAHTSCLGCPPFLLKTDNHNYASLFACADKCGVLSIWLVGEETKPLFVIDQISNSTCNDLAWTKDGTWLLIAVESDPVTREGGLVCIRFLKEFELPKADLNEMEEIKARLLGETSFKLKSKHTQNAANILQSLEVKEKEIDLEVLQLTTEEVLERQVVSYSGKDGICTIQPVLLTAVEKQLISFQCNVECDSKGPHIPFEFNIPNLNWPKPAALSEEPSHVLICDDCVVCSSGVCVYKLSKNTGQRIASPFCISGKCRHLSTAAGVVLAVGSRCFVLSLKTLECIFSCECPDDFVNFGIITDKIILGHSRGKVWLYDSSAEAWVGGVLTKQYDDASMEEIERFAKLSEHESAASQWYDFGISTMFSAYSGEYKQIETFLSEMKENDNTEYAKKYIDKLETTLKSRWGAK
ncbi:hypothetical protein TRFO_22687 [Tritrichomonas foetus]|uniref:CAF1B/HIR1 beta-propeller domain-containing protein n=1 Tax=Tritrichomonas foetus TaxID=1144522 RepID=A0A1J4KBI2_9EUKA|nr:hypothetical protein TRFO_22687 [Tritrichomonas foetus]|eukprot:OHT08767.1 hypothetical protein TRFO_22687 [Tritrichomonas foetus]